MPDSLTDYLSVGTGKVELATDTLENMGKRAANLLLDHGVPLNEGIRKVASEYNDINHDQIKRVVEFANIASYLAQHDKNKTAGAESSYPQFELADASVIIASMNKEASQTIESPTSSDYGRSSPKKEKMASDKSDALLSELFGIAEAEKRASADYSFDTGVDELMSTKHTLKDLKSHLGHSLDTLLETQKVASDEYYDLVKRHMLDGGDFSHVMAAVRSTEAEDEKIAEVIKPVVERLLTEKVASSKQLNQAIRNLEKVAFRVVNPNHPMVTSFSAIVLMNQEIEKTSAALANIQSQSEIVQKAIQEIFFAK